MNFPEIYSATGMMEMIPVSYTHLPHYAGGRCADKLEEYTAVLGNRASLDSIAGTYNGVLPPDVETTLTLNADGTYLLIQTFKEKQNEQERLKGSFQVLEGNILMLVHPLSGDNILQGEGCYFVNIIYFTSLTDFTFPLGLVLNSRAWLFASGIE